MDHRSSWHLLTIFLLWLWDKKTELGWLDHNQVSQQGKTSTPACSTLWRVLIVYSTHKIKCIPDIKMWFANPSKCLISGSYSLSKLSVGIRGVYGSSSDFIQVWLLEFSKWFWKSTGEKAKECQVCSPLAVTVWVEKIIKPNKAEAKSI